MSMPCLEAHPLARPAPHQRPAERPRGPQGPAREALAAGRRRAGLRAVQAPDAPAGEAGPPGAAGEQEEELTEGLLDSILEEQFAPDALDLPYTDGAIVNDTQTVLGHREIALMLGLGTWRLAASVGPILQALGAHIECNWRHNVPDLGLYQLPEEFRYMDSMDPEGTRTGRAYGKVADPQKGEPGYPRLRIENRAYQSRVFRKLHLEIARRQDGLEVLHCVMYPRTEFDLPILSLDVVAVHNRVSLAITDPCPCATNRSLPPFLAQGVRMLQERHGLSSNRATPEWGAAIFSDLCVLLRPQGPQDMVAYQYYTDELLSFYLTLAAQLEPVQHNRETRLADIRAAHARYAAKQLENKKTARILVEAFGQERATAYMEQVMFDTEPEGGGGSWDPELGAWRGQGGVWPEAGSRPEAEAAQAAAAAAAAFGQSATQAVAREDDGPSPGAAGAQAAEEGRGRGDQGG